MTRRRRLLVILAAVAAATIGTVVVVAEVFVPPWVRGAAERATGEALGRELKIAGTFRLAYSLEPAVVAEGVTLANAAWGSEPAMIRADRVEAALDLASVWNPPLRVKSVTLEGVHVLLEKDREGMGNWRFDLKRRPATEPQAAPRQPLLVERAAIRDFELVYRARPDAPPFRFGVARLEARHDAATDMVELEATGHFNDAPWDLAGRLGVLARLYAMRDVSHDLSGHVGNAQIALRGRIRDPLSLGDPELEARLQGPDVAAALATVGLRSPLTGPFEARGRFSPSSGGVAVEGSASVAGVTASARGRVAELLRLDGVDAELEASGPDASVVGRWLDVDGFPARPFEASGRLRREGRRVTVDDVKARIGATSLTAGGTIGTLPRGAGTDLRLTAGGSDLSELSALGRLPLPKVAFDARGRFLRRADALAVEGVELHLQGGVVHATGTIGEPPALANLDLAFDAAGPDLSRFSEIAGAPLPQAPFELRGSVARAGAGFRVDRVEGSLGSNAVKVDGTLAPAPRLAGSELQVSATGPDLAEAGALAGLKGLAAVPYEVAGRVRVASDGYALDGVTAQAGSLSARVSGRVGARPVEDGVDLEGSLAGRALSDLSAWGVERALPDDPFEISGRVRLSSRVVAVEGAVAAIGDDRLRVDGTLGTFPGAAGLDAAIDVSGPRLSGLGRFFTAGGGEATPRLPVEPYAATARVRRVPEGFALHDTRATLGNAELRIDGLLATGERLRGTDLRLEARAPDGAIVAELLGVAMPAGAIELRGRVARTASGLHFDGVTAAIGDAHAEVTGTLGDAPDRAGTDLEIAFAGPDLAAVLGPLTGLSPVPAEAFEASTHLEGDVHRIASRRFVARLGENDLEGSVTVRLDARTTVDADLRSQRLSLVRLLGQPVEATEAEVAPKPAPSKKRILPDEPLGLGSLRTVDARIRLTGAEVAIPGFVLRDVVVEAALNDGTLRVDHAEGSGVYGGKATAQFSVEPVGDAYRLRASGGITGGRITVADSTVAPDQAPTIDVGFEVEGTGRTPREIAVGSRGGGLVTIGPGRLPTNRGGFISSGVVRSLLDALNPFRKSSPYTEVECAVVVADIAGGRATVEPVAARTDKLTILGRGKVDLETEGIDFVWTLKPRKGVGITPGSIANPYIKLGGTMASPSLEAKPLEAAASTGAAVATGGLTVLFRGLYDRITAERKVCVRAIEEAERQAAKREAVRAEESP